MENTPESGVQVIDADGPAWEDLLSEVLTDDPDMARSSFIQSAVETGCTGGGHCACNSTSGTSTTPSIGCTVGGCGSDCGGLACTG